ncbi:hypothetical protein ACKI1O_50440, partial [Streptomyces scabiei]
ALIPAKVAASNQLIHAINNHLSASPKSSLTTDKSAKTPAIPLHTENKVPISNSVEMGFSVRCNLLYFANPNNINNPNDKVK